MRNYHCLAVDDEPLLLQRLTKMFERLPGFELVGSGCSAAEGIELALQLKPDIIITDIVMPGKNGIDMIAELKDQLPDTIFIVLSSYPDFQYAQQAISMDVLEYLVKVPLRENLLLEALQRAGKKLEEREQSRREITRLNQERRENIYRLRKQLMEEICTGGTSPDELRRLSDYLLLDIPAFSGDNSVLIGCAVKIDRYPQFQMSYSALDQKLLRYGILNIMEEIISQEGARGFCCELGASRFAVILFLQRVHSEHQTAVAAGTIGRRLIGNIKNYLKLSVSIGVGSAHSSLYELPAAWEEAVERLTESFYSGSETFSIAASSLQPAYASAHPAEFNDVMEAIEAFVRAKDHAGIERSVRLLKHQLLAKRMEPSELLILLSDFSAQLSGRAWSGNPPEPSLPPRPFSPEHTDLEQELERLQALCEACMSVREEAGKEREEIRKSKDFIELHLSQGIYLEQVARHVNMNPSYFSELFKREVKEGLSEYVNRKRIEKAIELLNTKEYSNIELAEAVGINNERYFCTLFKKFTGDTPQKYKTLHNASRRQK
jgi:two-component system response regulator YesN